MPTSLPLLYELEITVSGRVDDGFPVSCALKEHGPYPPEPKREGNGIVFSSRILVDTAGGWRLPSYLVSRLVKPEDVTEGNLDFHTRMRELAEAVFQPPAEQFLHRLLSASERFDAYNYQPRSLSRITLIFEGVNDPAGVRMLQLVPWELMSWGNQQLRQSCVFLRRSLAKSGEKSGSFDLPLNVAFVSETKVVSQSEIGKWGPSLFDSFTAEARDLGGIEWGDAVYGMVKLGEVHHVVFDSSDNDSWVPLYDDIQRLGEMRAANDPWSVPPRLLVLHDVSGVVPPYFDSALLLHSALANGADAVLLVALPSANPREGDFFSTFYRKLMHNWPLDQCVWEALSVSRANTTPVDAIFGARQGGEFQLLLRRAALEATLVKPVPKVLRRTLGLTRSGRTELDQVPRMASERSSRVALDIEASLRRVAENQKDMVFEAMVDRTRDITFDRELDGVTEVVDARKHAGEMAGAAAAEIRETEAMASSVAEASPKVMQEAMVRLTNLWITEDRTPEDPRIITTHDYLVSRKPYNLHVQIGPRREGALVAERFNEESLKKIFEKVDEVMLDVMFFTTDKDFKLAGDQLEEAPGKSEGQASEREVVDGEERWLRSERGRWGRRAKLRLPRFGPSSELTIEITPIGAGLRRIRTCIYYRNVLLQSVLLEAEVAEEGTEQAGKALSTEKPVITGRTTDYIATVDFALLDELPQPSLNIFSNHDGDGTHWVGAYSTGDTSALRLESGDMRVFDKQLLNTRAQRMREILIKIEGEKSAYKLDAPLPLSGDDIKRREGYLRDLAVSGWRLFHPLFMVSSDGDGDDNAKRLEGFRNTTRNSHIISIARCGPDSSTLPWAALYSNYIDTNKEDEISLCGVFKQQLADNVWEGGILKEKHDLLDDPKKCRGLAECPLGTAQRKVTVCPFGFWGFIHQVEQPLQQVKPTPVDEEPEALQNHNFGQTSFLTRAAGDPVNVAVGAYPGIPDALDHKADIEALPLSVAYRDERDQVMLLLTEGGQHVYYFYCHGDLDETEKIFSLKLGPVSKPGYIESSNLTPDEIEWETPKPLFILNRCDTMAVTPDVTHGFLNTLKTLGASGVIGTEVKVWTQLARPFGLQLLKHLLNGMSVGEAFLEARKNLLRQYNPLGLIYSYYAPATLHLHDPASCTWCESHKH